MILTCFLERVNNALLFNSTIHYFKPVLLKKVHAKKITIK